MTKVGFEPCSKGLQRKTFPLAKDINSTTANSDEGSDNQVVEQNSIAERRKMQNKS
ncbi:putative nose resistant to fluoxetine [Sesbania bispinosa]|nr:putative nose resistant to fluoxetine [Sesbania bispinosa]